MSEGQPKVKLSSTPPKEAFTSDQAGLLYMHFNSARMQPDRSYATGTKTKKDCVEVCINIFMHAYTHCGLSR